MAEDKKGSVVEKPQKDSTTAPLAALQTMCDSAYRRWEKRRNYEWLLSISIWATIAAFSSLVLNKDFAGRGDRGLAVAVFVLGTVGSGAHLWYLGRIAAHTLADVSIQRLAEQKMYELAFGTPMSEEQYKCCYPPLKKYGLVRAVITWILVLAACLAIYVPAPRISKQVTQITTASP